jgi:hypothetical protein
MCFLLLLTSSLQQNWRKGQNKFCLEASGAGRKGGSSGGGWGQGEEMTQTMCAHMNEYIKNKNNKRVTGTIEFFSKI